MAKRDPEQVRLAMESDQVGGGIVDLAVYLQQGGDPNVRVGPRRAPLLHVAFEALRLESLELLLQGGADIDVADPQGRTLLHLAVETDIDGAVQNGWPLTMAWTRLTLRWGADPARRDHEGGTPGDDARAYGPEAERAYARALRETRPPDGHARVRGESLDPLVFIAERIARKSVSMIQSLARRTCGFTALVAEG